MSNTNDDKEEAQTDDRSSVRIVAESLILDSQRISQGLFADKQEIRIFADQLEIRGTLAMHGASVHILARRIVGDENAGIDVSGLKVDDGPEATAGSDGIDGNDAGSVVIRADEIAVALHIKADGSDGGDGHAGKDGKPGSTPTARNGEFKHNWFFGYQPGEHGGGQFLSAHALPGILQYIISYGEPGRNGTKGTAGGNGGKGGNAGNGGCVKVRTIDSLRGQPTVSVEKGECGIPGAPGKPGNGGAAGLGGIHRVRAWRIGWAVIDELATSKDERIVNALKQNGSRIRHKNGKAGARGKPGMAGADGVPGRNGEVEIGRTDHQKLARHCDLDYLKMTERRALNELKRGREDTAVEMLEWLQALTIHTEIDEQEKQELNARVKAQLESFVVTDAS